MLGVLPSHSVTTWSGNWFVNSVSRLARISCPLALRELIENAYRPPPRNGSAQRTIYPAPPGPDRLQFVFIPLTRTFMDDCVSLIFLPY